MSSFLSAQSLTDSLQSIIEQAQSDLNIAGISAAINFADESIWTGVSGLAGQNLNMNDQYIFPIGSASKTLVAASILRLMEEGQLSLSDSLGTWLQSHPNIDGSISIKQLLNHTSGIYNYTSHPSFFTDVESDYSQIFQPEDLLNYVDAPEFPAGTNWAYSNTNYMLLGFILEEVSGLEFHEVIRSYVLDPLQLSDVNIFPFEAFNQDLAHLFDGPSTDLFTQGLMMDTYLSSAWAAGAYTSRPSDLSKMIKGIYDGSILQQSSLDSITEEMYYMGNIDYGLGTMTYNIWPETTIIGHGGDIFYTTQAYYDPSLDISINVHANDKSIFASSLFYLILELREVVKYFESLDRSRLELKVFLEGNYNEALGEMHNLSFLEGLMPFQQPYNMAPWDCPYMNANPTIPGNTVDWVLVEAMVGIPTITGSPGLSRIAQKVGLLQKDGSIYSPDGTLGLEFTELVQGEEYYFIVRHRNHLDVLTSIPLIAANSMNYDFSQAESQAFGSQQMKLMQDGSFAMFAGDYSPDGVIQNTDFDQWKTEPAILNTYQITDGNLDGSVQATDYDTWLPNNAKIGVVEVRY